MKMINIKILVLIMTTLLILIPSKKSTANPAVTLSVFCGPGAIVCGALIIYGTYLVAKSTTGREEKFAVQNSGISDSDIEDGWIPGARLHPNILDFLQDKSAKVAPYQNKPKQTKKYKLKGYIYAYYPKKIDNFYVHKTSYYETIVACQGHRKTIIDIQNTKYNRQFRFIHYQTLNTSEFVCSEN